MLNATETWVDYWAERPAAAGVIMRAFRNSHQQGEFDLKAYLMAALKAF